VGRIARLLPAVASYSLPTPRGRCRRAQKNPIRCQLKNFFILILDLQTVGVYKRCINIQEIALSTAHYIIITFSALVLLLVFSASLNVALSLHLYAVTKPAPIITQEEFLDLSKNCNQNGE